MQLSVRPDARVSGTLSEASGRPASVVRLKLLGKYSHATQEVWTNTEGSFTFFGVLPDTYFLGVNIGSLDDPSPQVPYRPTFYPGVARESTALAIDVSEFEKVQLSDLRLPRRLEPRSIEVVVLLDDGRPIQGVSVSCTLEGRSPWKKSPTDSSGRISFEVMDQLPYIVDVGIPSDHALIRSDYERAKWVKVSPGSGTAQVKVVFQRRQ